ncbi:polyketide synthase family protein (plasmid) [Cylindrospermum stagnale PCC 7417]|uniref:Phenolphthiocerol/phthiocerol polyketide synthase subunit E n=1 Tax=Cylindrospermum stagnale PCC 7417 TaxID=56107 RepID=K9X846_9NOST|nr:type I polyketide synthase [Cylindrospermum stagnale]AFZ28246.1 polyketide synthase family protein [Cylindrospermum stagnale PCC 7417]
MYNLETQDSLEPIAIIGMTGRFPGANNVDKFWQNLVNGVESITFFTDEELIASGVDPALLNSPNYVKAKGVLEDIEMFDALFFGFTAKEAELMDPQHRLFLECAWEALENAGYDSEVYDGRIGVYAGAGLNIYLARNLISNHDLIESAGNLQVSIGNDKDYVPTRVSYKLNLTGPSINVNTACSTSLVTVHLACQSLLNYQCDMALAGGVSIYTPQKEGYVYQNGGIASPDGHCRAFDARAQGTVDGNGVGIVVLKRLEDALANGDYIYAVIKGSAINNDGSLKVGYTAPSESGQAAVISEALAVAGIEAEDISYIETHGTGTTLGDPIEIAALTQAFQTSTQKKGFCAIGSVKTNIGHLDAAAGVAGLIKTTLALKHKLLLPSLNFEKPSPNIDFANSRFYVNTTLSKWTTDGTPCRAGVSSFGIGGTNAHIVLEEAPVDQTQDVAFQHSRPWQVLSLSAKTSSALDEMTANLAAYLKQHPDLNFADVAYTLAVGRRAFEHRRIVVCQKLNEAGNALELVDPQRVFTSFQELKERSVVFMFSGQGSQYVNMGRELYQTEPTFRKHIDLCLEILKPHLGFDLQSVLYPQEELAQEAAQQLKQTAIAQPALFAIAYSLAQLWMSWGVHPKAMIGHSIGEYVAATLAGVLSLKDALALVASRGQLMQQLPTGGMLAIHLPEKEVQALLNVEILHTTSLQIAAINGQCLCVVSGCTDDVETLQNQLAEKSVNYRRLHTSHAFHSEMMDTILEPFTFAVKKVTLNPPQIPYLSNVTGTWIAASQATDPNYWAKHLRSCVRFSEGLQQLLKEPEQILLEVGPGRTLSTLATQHSDKTAKQVVLNSLRHPQDRQSDVGFLLTILGKLWLFGVKVNWSGFYSHQKRLRVPLPTYPFERQRYWIEPQKQLDHNRESQVSLGKKPDVADWFYLPYWKASIPPVSLADEELVERKSSWLVFIDDCGLGSQIVERLERDDCDVISVKVAAEFTQQSDRTYTLNPQQADDYNTLVRQISAQREFPNTIVHLWSVTKNSQTISILEGVDKAQDLGLHSLIFLAQALGKHNVIHEIQLTAISNNVQPVTTEEELCPEKATILGAIKIIPQEYSSISCRSIDIVLPKSGTRNECKLIDQLLNELQAKSSDLFIAYRGLHRWVQTFEPVRLNKPSETKLRLREQGVYLITGGLGGVGFTLGEHLAKSLQAKLILLGRSAFPAPEKWAEWLATQGEDNDISRKIRKIQELEQLGAEILVVSADVANEEQMQAVIAKAQQRFGSINGVIHTAAVVDYAGVIQRRVKEMTESVLAPKVRGTLVLSKLLEHVEIDFLILCSSVGVVLYKTKFGEVSYVAANEFLDVFSYYNTCKNGTFTVSINWDDWQEVGMSVEAVKNAVKRNFNIIEEKYLQNALLPSEGADVFMRILNSSFPQVTVSTEDLTTRIKLNDSFSKISFESLEKVTISKTAHPRPELSNVYVAPHNELEQTISEIWQQQLGIEKVGIYDNFFELGGHSLLATQVISRIREAVQIELSLNNLFEEPTVAGISAIVEKKLLTTQKQQITNSDIVGEREEIKL